MSAQSSDALQRVARLLKILTLIRSRRPGELLGRPQLAEACGCAERTIQRDIDLLQSQTPLAYDHTAKTYTLPAKGWAYPIVELTVPDVLALALARGAVSSGAFPHSAYAVAALDKIAGGLTPGLKALLAEASGVVRMSAPVRDYSKVRFDLLQRAAAEHLTVEIDYESRSGGERSWRSLDPYLIEQQRDGRWDLHGWCHRRKAIRTFAADRVTDARLAGEGFLLRAAEWEAFAGASGIVGGMRGGPEVTVDVKFDKVAAPYALDRRWPVGLTVEPDGDGARLTGAVAGHEGILPEILRWRRHAIVRGGSELRARFAEEVHAMAALYADLQVEKD